jgi:hypothetical protein
MLSDPKYVETLQSNDINTSELNNVIHDIKAYEKERVNIIPVLNHKSK